MEAVYAVGGGLRFAVALSHSRDMVRLENYML